MKGGGLALKSCSLFPRIIQFGCGAVILGIYSYFLAYLSKHDLTISSQSKAVEGISGSAVLYTIFAFAFVCCLGGIKFFSFIGMLLDICFAGAFAYVAYACRHGANSCTGTVQTPLGTGPANLVINQSNGNSLRLPNLHTICRLNTACFAVAIIGALFFLISIPIELAMIKHRKKEKAFGPGPNNGYTAGSPRRKFWQRKPKHTAYVEKNPDALPVHHTNPAAVRDSYTTDATAVGNEVPYNKYGKETVPHHNGHTTHTTTHGGYAPYAAGANGQTHAPGTGF